MKIYISLTLLFLLSGHADAQYDASDWNDIIEISNEERINTEKGEFSPTYWKEYITYVGSRSRQKLFDKKTNEPFYDLFLSSKNKGGQLDRTAGFSKKINTPYHEGPMTFTTDGNKMLFTRVDYSNGDLRMNEEKIVLNKIWESSYANGIWSEATLSHINIEEYASCHPSLSRDNKILIFSSDRPGGFGKMDLYISHRENDQWTTPINMGPEINTEENEVFPFVHDNDYLLYSSNYNSEKNDLDIYKIKISIPTKNQSPIKLCAPINTNYDDFGITLDELGLQGYMSSNRPGGKGNDDIYKFQSTKSISSYGDKDYNKVKVIVKNKTQNIPMPNITIKLLKIEDENFLAFDQSLFDFADKDYQTFYTNENGEAYIQINDGYNLIGIQEAGMEKWQMVLSSKKSNEQINVLLAPEKLTEKRDTIVQYIERPAKPMIGNVEIVKGATIVLNNIYYDYNSHEIKKGAANELDELAKIMLANPNLKVQLSAHTDARGDIKYNQKLSEKRANSAKLYLTNKGIASMQISTVGYGEYNLRNHCKDGIKCSEAEHIYNRRTEVKVLDN